MKKITFLLMAASLMFFTGSLQSQENFSCLCGTEESPSENPFGGPIGTTTVNVVVAFIDFPDGRLQPGNIVPTEDWQLSQVANIDAVLNMGYLSNDGSTYTDKARKYTYADCWNRFFSVDTYIKEAHPDWMSHGRFGYPLGAGGDINKSDTAKCISCLLILHPIG